jgi:putative oxidoreductase
MALSRLPIPWGVGAAFRPIEGTMTSIISRLFGVFDLLPYSLIALLARVIVGLVFFKSWLTKIDLATWSIKPATFFLFANEYKVPLIPADMAVYMASTAELLCPLLLWAGLLTRLGALVLIGMVLVIQTFVYPNAYMDHGLWAIGLLMLIKFGPGKLSLDWLTGLDRQELRQG